MFCVCWGGVKPAWKENFFSELGGGEARHLCRWQETGPDAMRPATPAAADVRQRGSRSVGRRKPRASRQRASREDRSVVLKAAGAIILAGTGF